MQESLDFPEPLDGTDGLTVLDLFSGIGGLASGFSKNGFRVTGVDQSAVSGGAFQINAIGDHVVADLSQEEVIRDVSLVVGGPPCRPWSAVNLQKRGRSHGDHMLMARFFEHVSIMRPRAFLMENVPPLRNDIVYRDSLRETEYRGYSVAQEVLKYSDFGAATTRRRLFTVGIRGGGRWGGRDFFEKIEEEHAQPSTVREAISWLRDSKKGAVPDHEWSELTTISKYSQRYRTGQYGWKVLKWDEPAPSFGSVAKTYILHPDADPDSGTGRVVSVREVLSILGFERTFRFPTEAGLSERYGMAANAVSPVVSQAAARTLRRMLFS